MAESLDDLLAKSESSFSVILQNAPMNNESLDKIQHLIEKDPALYQYFLLKESSDASTRQMMQYEHSTTLRSMIMYFKEFEHKDQETKVALYTLIDQNTKEIKSLKMWRWIAIGSICFACTVGFWGLYILHPEGAEAVIRFVKALGSVINIF